MASFHVLQDRELLTCHCNALDGRKDSTRMRHNSIYYIGELTRHPQVLLNSVGTIQTACTTNESVEILNL